MKRKQEREKRTDNQADPVRRSRGIGFLLSPLLVLLNALSSLPASLIVGVTLPRLLTPFPWPYPIIMTSDSRLEWRPCPYPRGLFVAYEARLGLFIDVGVRGTLEFLLALFPPPPKYNLNLAEGPRRSCSSRMEPIVEEDHFDLSIGLGEGERSSEEVGCIEARGWCSSKQLAMSVSKSALGLEGSEGGSIIGYSASSSPPTSISKSTSNRKSSDSDEYEHALLKSRSSS